MRKRAATAQEDLAERSLRYTRDQFEQVLHQAEEYVHEKPAQSLLCAFAAGFILNRLPICRMLGVGLRLFSIALKPAVLIYGASRLYQSSQREE